MMLQTVADVLRRRGGEGWLVGGSVRDRELGRDSPDLDIVVTDDAAAVAKEIAAALGAPWFLLSARHPAYRVVGPAGHLDVAAARGGGILDDLAERDFTINAMARPLGRGLVDGRPAGADTLIDPFGGLAHLEQKRLVAVSERIFNDDPLRLMRAARFCHVLGFEMDTSLAASVRARAPELARAAAERVAAEVTLTLAEGRTADAVRLWSDLGLLTVVMPEAEITARLEPALALVERLDDLLRMPEEWFPLTADALAARMAVPVDGAVAHPVALRLAGVMHGLAPGHVEAAARRLKLSGAVVSLFGTIDRNLPIDVRLHGGPGGLETSPPRATRQEVLFLWDAAPWEPEVIVLAAVSGTPAAGRLMILWAERALGALPCLPVDGDVLMRELGLGPGPLLGEALREARLAWETGQARTADEALAVARAAAGAG